MASYDDYLNKRSWLIDTAETPAQKKALKDQLAKLDAAYKAKKASPTPSPTRIAPMQSKAEEKAQAKALDALMKKRAAAAKKTGRWPNYGTN